MAVKEVLMLGNPLLREKSKNVDSVDKEVFNIVKDMQDTLENCKKIKNIGRAIAAPQIGVLKNIIVAESDSLSQVFINPEIIEKSDEIMDTWDSCFSFDVAFFVKIKRHESIKVKFIDTKGETFVKEYSGDVSELLQHEIDHLNGILATDLLDDNKDIILRSEWKKLMDMV